MILEIYTCRVCMFSLIFIPSLHKQRETWPSIYVLFVHMQLFSMYFSTIVRLEYVSIQVAITLWQFHAAYL